MIGYKAFNGDGTNRFGKKYELNKDYHIDGPILASTNNKNGFFFCKTVGEVFRFFDPEDVTVGLVEVSGEIDRYYDWYNDYEIYAASDMKVVRYLSRQEILYKLLFEGLNSIDKAIQTYKFNELEKDLLMDNLRGKTDLILKVLYYYYGMTDIFYKEQEEMTDIIDDEYKKIDKKLAKVKRFRAFR